MKDKQGKQTLGRTCAICLASLWCVSTLGLGLAARVLWGLLVQAADPGFHRSAWEIPCFKVGEAEILLHALSCETGKVLAFKEKQAFLKAKKFLNRNDKSSLSFPYPHSKESSSVCHNAMHAHWAAVKRSKVLMLQQQRRGGGVWEVPPNTITKSWVRQAVGYKSWGRVPRRSTSCWVERRTGYKLHYHHT